MLGNQVVTTCAASAVSMGIVIVDHSLCNHSNLGNYANSLVTDLSPAEVTIEFIWSSGGAQAGLKILGCHAPNCTQCTLQSS